MSKTTIAASRLNHTTGGRGPRETNGLASRRATDAAILDARAIPHPRAPLRFRSSHAAPPRAARLRARRRARSSAAFKRRTTRSGGSPLERDSGRRCRLRLRIELETEAVGEPREVIEQADDVRHLEAGAIVEAEPTQRLPVGLDHPRRRRAQLLRELAKGTFARRERVELAPAARLDRLDQLRIATLDTQKLCVRVRSVVAVLRRRSDRRHEFALAPLQHSIGREHHLVGQPPERRTDPPVRGHQPRHRRQEAEVERMPTSGRQRRANLLLARHFHPRLGVGVHRIDDTSGAQAEARSAGVDSSCSRRRDRHLHRTHGGWLGAAGDSTWVGCVRLLLRGTSRGCSVGRTEYCANRVLAGGEPLVEASALSV